MGSGKRLEFVQMSLLKRQDVLGLFASFLVFQGGEVLFQGFQRGTLKLNELGQNKFEGDEIQGGERRRKRSQVCDGVASHRQETREFRSQVSFFLGHPLHFRQNGAVGSGGPGIGFAQVLQERAPEPPHESFQGVVCGTVAHRLSPPCMIRRTSPASLGLANRSAPRSLATASGFQKMPVTRIAKARKIAKLFLARERSRLAGWALASPSAGRSRTITFRTFK